MSRRTHTVEVSLDDFDDDAILEAAREIENSTGGLDTSENEVRELASAIRRGETEVALALLERLVQPSNAMVAAVQIARASLLERMH